MKNLQSIIALFCILSLYATYITLIVHPAEIEAVYEEGFSDGYQDGWYDIIDGYPPSEYIIDSIRVELTQAAQEEAAN